MIIILNNSGNIPPLAFLWNWFIRMLKSCLCKIVCEVNCTKEEIMLFLVLSWLSGPEGTVDLLKNKVLVFEDI